MRGGFIATHFLTAHPTALLPPEGHTPLGALSVFLIKRFHPRTLGGEALAGAYAYARLRPTIGD